MIFYLVTGEHAYTMQSFLMSWGKALAGKIRVLSYTSLVSEGTYPPGTYIFSDIERLGPDESEMLSGIWEELAVKYKTRRLLNHPVRSMKRFDLLRTLYERGVNRYNIYRLKDGIMPERFPVFIRRENDHMGSLTRLIYTPADLKRIVSEISERDGVDGKVLIEFCQTSAISNSDRTGIFRKYSAFIVGDRIIPRHVFFSRQWMIKDPELFNELLFAEELHYVENNPHKVHLKDVFRIARIGYGRIDYGILEGRPQVWEINTNPMLASGLSSAVPQRRNTHECFVRNITSAFEEIDGG